MPQSGQQAGRDFQRLDFHSRRPGDLKPAGDLRAHLEEAQFELLSFADPPPLVIRLAELSELTLAHARGSRVSGRWNRIAGSSDRALIMIVREGEHTVTLAHGASATGHGAFIVLPGSGTVTFGSPDGYSDAVYLSFPGRLTAPLLASSGLVHSQAAGVPDSVFAPAAAFVASVCALPAEDNVDGSLFEGVGEEIVRAVVHHSGGALPEGPQSLYPAALALIDAGYASRSLTGATLAAQLGVSLRTLQSVFNSERRSIAEAIRQARADGAIRLAREQPRLTQARIAALAGFGSVDSLHRALRLAGAAQPATPPASPAPASPAPAASAATPPASAATPRATPTAPAPDASAVVEPGSGAG